MEKRLRFSDLCTANIVRNRTTLRNWIEKEGFPQGRLDGPNTRTWGETEISDWQAKRPVEPKPTPQPEHRPGRPRKSEEQVTVEEILEISALIDSARG
jgi:hypothetical protein